MHPSAMHNGEIFFKRYLHHIKTGSTVKVVDIGAQDVNGSLREVCPDFADYIGVDFIKAKGVDVVLDDPYQLPFANNSIDVVVSSSCFEHSEMFWILFLEVLRILKPNGLFYLNAPSNGSFHRYPVDCWRFFPDSGKALISWAKRNGHQSFLLESFVSHQKIKVWNDFIAVYVKHEQFKDDYPERMSTGRDDVENITLPDEEDIQKYTAETEDLRRIKDMGKQLAQIKKIMGC